MFRRFVVVSLRGGCFFYALPATFPQAGDKWRYSCATVSKVPLFSSLGGIETREEVRHEAQTLGYDPG
jgi:hypothetical protein